MRDVYTIGDDLMVAVVYDRISAFDVVMPRGIPFKGQVLNGVASHFLNAVSDIVRLERGHPRPQRHDWPQV